MTITDEKSKLKRIFIAAFLIAAILSGCTKSNENPYLTKGNNYLASNSYSLALEQYKLAINDDPELTDAYLQACKILIAKGKYQEAQDLLKQGSEYALLKTSIFVQLGDLSFSLKDYPAALNYYNQALEKDNTYQQAVLGKINSLILTNNDKDMNSFVENLDPAKLSQEMQLIRAVILIDDQNESLNSLKLAESGSDSNLAKQSAKIQELLTTYYTQEDKLFTLAQIAYEALTKKWDAVTLPISNKMIDINEYYEGGYIYKGTVYLHLGEYDIAETNLEKAQALNGNLSDTKILLAQVKFAKNKVADGNKLLQFAKEPIATIEEEKFYNIIKLLVSAKQYQTATDFLGTYTAIRPVTLPGLQILQLQSFWGLDQFSETKAYAEELLTIKENFNNQELAIIYSNLGISQFYLGEKAAGLDSLDLANATDPTYAPGFYFAG